LKILGEIILLRVLIIIVLSLRAGFSNGQISHNINYISQESGLSQTTNQFIFKDSRGFVWISTANGGLNRYDGQKIKIYEHNPNDPTSLPDNLIQSDFIEDSLGNIWFSTQSALVCYVRKHDNFISFRQNQNNTSYHLSFVDKSGRFGVIINNTELYLFNSNDPLSTAGEWVLLETFPSSVHRTIPRFSSGGEIQRILGFNKDRPGLHVFSYEQSDKSSYSFIFAGEDDEPEFQFSSVILQKDSILWALSQSGLLKIEVDKDPLKAYKLYSSFNKRNEADLPNSITPYDEEKILATFTNDSWSILDVSSPSSIISEPYNSIWNPWETISSSIQGISVDEEGVIWIGINGDGVYFFHPRKSKFRHIRVGELWNDIITNNAVFALTKDSLDNIWYTNRRDGIFRMSPSFRPIEHFYVDSTARRTLNDNDIHYLLIDSKNRCWAFSYKKSSSLGIYHPNLKAFQSVLTDYFFLYGIELDDGRLIFSSYEGLCEISENGSELKVDTISSIDSGKIYTRLFQSKDGLLWGARNLSHIDIINPTDQFRTIKSLPIEADILSFYEDTLVNTLWVGTSIGLMCIDKANWEYEIYDKSNGLSDNNIYSILGSNDGALWLSTNQGLVKYNPGNQQFHSFDIFDGLQAHEFNREGSVLLKNGEFVFGGQNGLNIFHPDSVNLITTRPKVQFTNVVINGGSVKVPPCSRTGATNISEIQEIDLGYSQNTLDIEFAALEFSYPKGNSFKYKMEGLQDEWKEIGNEGSVRFINLPSGNYNLWVVGISSDGIESIAKKIEINIAPFWQTGWFWLLTTMLVLSITVIYYRNRINRIQRLQNLRYQISDDLHDDIGASLSSINILINFIREYIDEDSKVKEYIEMIENEAKASYQSMDDIVWCIKPENDSLDKVLSRMRYFVNIVTEAKDIKCRLNFPDKTSHIRIAMDKRRHFYLIFKEAVNNSIKYSLCTEITIELKFENHNFFMSITDNGVGFDADMDNVSGNGLRTMRERAKKLGGDLGVKSTLGLGTVVSLSFPYGRNL
jgi:streptogramin lyase